jgi:magnesium chelatase subunit H
MPPNNRDAGYLWDMLQAARRLQEFTAGSFRNIVGRMLEANGRGFCQPSEEKLEKLR